MSRAVGRYLSRHARIEHHIGAEIPGAYAHAVVIPACREPDLGRCLDAVVAASRSTRALVICVVNARADAGVDTHRENAATLEQFHCSGRPHALCSLSESCDLLVVNRAEQGRYLAEKRGVGTARRIGADIALKLWERGGLSTGWIHSTDADARVPADYFQSPPDATARVIPFRHRTERTALHLYELSLRLYVLGLARGGSPYAFQTIGSALAFRCEAYAQVGGFPEREAGEDFYLLNKLAKVGPVLRSAADPILLVDRDSDRVPFGTGPGARRVEAARASEGGFRTYDPRSFRALGQWNHQLRRLAIHRAPATVAAEMQRFDPRVWSCLCDLGVEGALEEAVRNTRTERDLRGRLFRSFDAFRTLRFIHLLRDRVWAQVPWREALRGAGEAGSFEVPEDVAVEDGLDLLVAVEAMGNGESLSAAG